MKEGFHILGQEFTSFLTVKENEEREREFRLEKLEGEDQDQEEIFRLSLQLSRIDSSIGLTD